MSKKKELLIHSKLDDKFYVNVDVIGEELMLMVMDGNLSIAKFHELPDEQFVELEFARSWYKREIADREQQGYTNQQLKPLKDILKIFDMAHKDPNTNN